MTAMPDQRIAMLERQIAALARQVTALSQRRSTPFALARSTLPVNDTGAVQTIQAQLDPLSVRDNIPALYNYGFTGSPPVGADLHVTFVDGDRSKAVAVASGHQTYRLRGLALGDSAQYDSRGAYIWLTPSGLVIDCAGLPMTVQNAPAATFDVPNVITSGNLTVGTGASGSFTSGTGQIVTVHDGIITNIF